MAVVQSTKKYGHEIGLSCAFRQWRATSHCRFLHGYALSFKFVFECNEHETDQNGWVVDFGGLKDLKKTLVDTFDHKTVVAKDDPMLDEFAKLHEKHVVDLVVLPNVGCERFAEFGAQKAQEWLAYVGLETVVRLVSCEVSEHGANSALFIPS